MVWHGARCITRCGLTPRSRRGPTARQPAVLQVVRIILPAGGLPRRRPRLTSNVKRLLLRQRDVRIWPNADILIAKLR